MLAAADIVALSSAFVIAEFATPGAHAGVNRIGTLWETLTFLATLPAWIVVAKLYGLYYHDEERTDHSTADDLVGVFHLVTVGAWFVFVVSIESHVARPQVLRVALFWLLAIVLVTLARAIARAYARRKTSYVQNALIVGAGQIGQLIAHKFLKHPEYGIKLLGFVDVAPTERREDIEELTLLGTPSDLPRLVPSLDIDRVIIAFSSDSHGDTLELIRSLKDHDVQIDIVPRLFEVVGPQATIHTVEGIPLVGLPSFRLPKSSKLLKSCVDEIGASIGLLLLSPLFVLIALLIKLDTPGPVFFRQIRVGKGDKLFRIYKFRTMVADADERKPEVAHLSKHLAKGGDPRMFKITDDPRITRVGMFLRRHSLDELPQLINVLKGEMSIVGPRPLILDEAHFVKAWGRARLDIKPGITGLWQVLGRSDIPFEEMVKLDYLYVTSWSFLTDLKLMLRTIPAIFTTRHAY
jgi:exopolysaccharide biosynthesis polyprenyl glycosylphosphotransferase